MIDKAEVKYRFRKSINTYDRHARVQQCITGHLAELIKIYVAKVPDSILEIGCGTGFLTGKIQRLFPTSILYINDLVEEMWRRTAVKCSIPENRCMEGDIETIKLPGRYDLIVSASVFQWFIDPSATFRKLGQILSPGNLLIFSTFGEENLYELRNLTGTGLKYLTKEESEEILNDHFEIMHIEEERRTLYFQDPMEVLQHLKQTGVNAVGSSQIWTKGRLQQFRQDYKRYQVENRGYALTYHPLYFVCRKK